ncbi:UNVERIFIED_CONTAM: hypothetical protein Slati_2173100 [Sesamum latifolium]|uniref:Uncharacterized protein n=1 Tax=Sesamum latifolium TaxID=2727402 RepID=A0AAW2WRQ3_9LAMI
MTESVRSRIASLKAELDDLSSKEELLWKQRTKALWLAEGDKNTAFFYAKENERRIRKEVRELRDDRRLLVSDLSKIRDIVQQYFGVIFRSTGPSKSVICEAVESMEG